MMTRRSPLPAAIWALGFTSLFMDISSEMIHALLPLYITGTLGAGVFAVGLIEGIAEATALIVKLFSGVISDITGKRKTLALIGYGLAALTKPLFPLASSLSLIVTARFIDRIGKGIRGAPRDALVADFAPPERRGEAFGLRQSLDSFGAFLGPLIAIALMLISQNDFNFIFWIACVPAFISVAILFVFVPERNAETKTDKKFPLVWSSLHLMPSAFWIVLGISAVLSFARISEAFLILRASDLGLPVAFAPFVLIAMNVIFAALAWPLGHLADRFSRRLLLAVGVATLAAASLCFAAAASLYAVTLGIALWGIHLALTQGLLATLIADAAPASLRGTAFGLFNLASGVAMLIGNMLTGWIWDMSGAESAFLLSTLTAAALLLALPWVRPSRE
ncbi:MAG: MFS transporter [Hyphomicrobiales bacterium]